jgi:hypothetical protein
MEPLCIALLGIALGHVAVVLPWRRRAPDEAARLARWRAARDRAEAALAAHLTPAERAQLRRDDYLAVPSPSAPGRVYHVPRWGELVEVYEGGYLARRLCIQPTSRLPEADVLLTHLLMIRADEAGYLRLANEAPPPHWL